jgi:uncharacterized YigZ family protein
LAVFRTIKGISSGEFKDRGSKFVAFAHPVETEDDVKGLLKKYKKEYPDARHHCLGFIIGEKGESFRAQDDGEPSNSAGAPILGQIRSFGLTNTIIIVIRYSSGTKLGVPGLINAYKSSARIALENAETIDSETKCTVQVKCPISEVDKLKSRVQKAGGLIQSVDYGESCSLLIAYPDSNESIPLLLQNFLT